MIKIGDLAKCRITGFSGVVTGVATFEFNEDRLCLQPRDLVDGKRADTCWLDRSGLDLIEAGVVSIVDVGTPAFKFGDIVKDKASPYQGKVVEITSFVNGCYRYGVQRDALNDKGIPVDYPWFAEKQLDLLTPVNPTTITMTYPKTGGPASSKANSALKRF